MSPNTLKYHSPTLFRINLVLVFYYRDSDAGSGKFKINFLWLRSLGSDIHTGEPRHCCELPVKDGSFLVPLLLYSI